MAAELVGCDTQVAIASREQIRALPKTELHAHLSGSISLTTLERLAVDDPEGRTTLEEARVWFGRDKSQYPTADQIFAAFGPVQRLVWSEQAVALSTSAVLAEFAADNVTYLELRTGPRQTPAFSARQYVSTIVDTIRQCEQRLGITVRLLLSLNAQHSVEKAYETLQLAVDFKSTGYVVGLDYSGDNRSPEASLRFIPVFQQARQCGLKLALHLCEFPGEEAVAEQLVDLKLVDRIGHGIFISRSESLLRKVQQARIPIELCPTSNLNTQGGVMSMSDYHFEHWFNIGHPIVVCTDDAGIFETSLTDELHLLASHFQLSIGQVQKLIENSRAAVFSPS